MKKKPPTQRVQDQVLRTPWKTNPRKSRPSSDSICSGSSSVPEHKQLGYDPHAVLHKEPSDMPRLFIRGTGGSIKMDLRGVGISCSGGVFAHRISDDSLKLINVLSGDIALVEPVIRPFRVGDLVLLDLDGEPVFRHLSKKNRFWQLSPLEDSSSETCALFDHPLQGVVIGFIRLLQELRPVRYQGTDANLAPYLETPSPPIKKATTSTSFVSWTENSTKNAKKIGTRYPSNSVSKDKILLSEVDKKKRYKVKPEKVDPHRWIRRNK